MMKKPLYVLTVILYFTGNIKGDNEKQCGTDGPVTEDIDGSPQPMRFYPWFGVLYFKKLHRDQVLKALTSVVLVHVQYVIASTSDIMKIPDNSFRKNTKVLLSYDWNAAERRSYDVDSYTLHPEYDEDSTLSSIALVRLATPAFKENRIWPICPPLYDYTEYEPGTYYMLTFKEYKSTYYKIITKVIPLGSFICKKFHNGTEVSHDLNDRKRYRCGKVHNDKLCLSSLNSPLVYREPRGRWRLVGFGTANGGCHNPIPFLNINHYIYWIIKTINNQESIVNHLRTVADQEGLLAPALRIGDRQFGGCDLLSFRTLLYEEVFEFRTTRSQPVSGYTRVEILDQADITCLTIAALRFSKISDPVLSVVHACPKDKLCHMYRNTTAVLEIHFTFNLQARLTLTFHGSREVVTEGLPDSNNVERD